MPDGKALPGEIVGFPDRKGTRAMKILHLLSNDITGGAARASYRLHQALLDAGHDSRMVVRHKASRDERVLEAGLSRYRIAGGRILWRMGWFRKLMLPRPTYVFNLDVHAPVKVSTCSPGSADAVCFHWITGFLGPEDIRRIVDGFRGPLLWVLMDLEPITGGCHYLFGCDRYRTVCGFCPQLGSRRLRDRSNRLWRLKKECLGDLPIVFVAPTRWVADRIRESSLFGGHRVVRIPLAVDTGIFRPDGRDAVRARAGIPAGKKVVFFGSTRLDDARKGMPHLAEALRDLSGRMASGEVDDLRPEDLLLLVAGERDEGLFSSIPFEIRHLGFLQGDEALADAYRTADLFVCPSIEDAGPMMVPEAMLCGTPVAAFDTGGAPDLVVHGENGYLARRFDSADLGEGIRYCLTRLDPDAGRASAHEAAFGLHAPEAVAGKYRELLREMGVAD